MDKLPDITARLRENGNGNQERASNTSGTDLQRRPAGESMKRVLSDRMTSSESLEAATQILNFYSVGKKDVGASYLGAIAQVLSSYPRQVAMRCATPHGIAATRPDFPPSVGHVIAWCEEAVAPLYAQEAREQHIEQQFREREEAAIPRAERPNISNYQHREPQQGRRAHLHVLKEAPQYPHLAKLIKTLPIEDWRIDDRGIWISLFHFEGGGAAAANAVRMAKAFPVPGTREADRDLKASPELVTALQEKRTFEDWMGDDRPELGGEGS